MKGKESSLSLSFFYWTSEHITLITTAHSFLGSCDTLCGRSCHLLKIVPSSSPAVVYYGLGMCLCSHVLVAWLWNPHWAMTCELTMWSVPRKPAFSPSKQIPKEATSPSAWVPERGTHKQTWTQLNLYVSCGMSM